MLRSRPRSTISSTPITAPANAESRMTSGSICQPIQAPIAPKQLEVAVAHAFLAGQQL